MSNEKLAILGGTPLIDEKADFTDLFKWPIITKEDEDAALEVIRAGKFSATDISMKLEENERGSRTRLMKVKDMMLDKAHNYSGV